MNRESLEQEIECRDLRLRKGQFVMDYISKHDYELYRELVTTGADCYYDDSKIDEVLEKVFGGTND